MSVNGLPLHPMIVHAAVVFSLLAALAAIAYAVPRWRGYLRWPLLVVGVLAAVLVWFASATGSSLENSVLIRRAMSVNPALAQAIHHHEDLAGKLQAVDWLLAFVSAVTWWWNNRPGWIRSALVGLLIVVGVASLVMVVLTGDAGARAVWKP